MTDPVVPLAAQTVVVPLDGSSYSERAIEPAKALATRLGVGAGAVRVVRHQSADDEAYLATVAGKHGLDWHEVVVDPDAAAGIRAVAQARSGIVCMATHGQGRATGLLGSTTQDVLTSSGDPLLVVGRGVSTTGSQRVDRVVIPLDGTPESETACEPAIGWARRLGLVVNLITVAGEPLGVGADEGGQVPRRAFGPPGDPQAYIDSAVKRFATDGVDVVGEVLIDPISVASGLGHLLRNVPHAVVAMATHGRTGAQRILHGSGAGAILDQSPVPVILLAV